MDSVTDREIRRAGTDESVWLPWLAEQRIQSAAMSALCLGKGRLVVVAPHPDDEILACGGLLAMRAERGLPHLIVAVSDGEASHGTSDPSLCARLGERRVKESYAGLKALGLSPPCIVRLGIPDGKAANMILSMSMKLLPLLKKADVIVTTWALDGHPDHEATNEAARQAAAKAGCRLLEAPVWMWHWATPGNLLIPWNRLVAVELHERALSAKRDALSCHRSQLEGSGEGLSPVLGPSIVKRAGRSREYFFVSAP